ncbi:uncharacterized protein [Diadema setosum]|uniref:uncharacterized protein n=1 Tax=Diadema setosum TaxID=31175 RepID=UPI003B3AF74A
MCLHSATSIIALTVFFFAITCTVVDGKQVGENSVYANINQDVEMKFYAPQSCGNCTYRILVNHEVLYISGRIRQLDFDHDKHERIFIKRKAFFESFIVILGITELRPSDKGLYKCIFKSGNFHTAQTYQLHIHYPPTRATCKQHNVSMSHLQCTATDGSPTGGIVCYSEVNGRSTGILPLSTSRQEDLIIAIFWGGRHNHLACCSVSKIYPKSQRDCTDFLWNHKSSHRTSELSTESTRESTPSRHDQARVALEAEDHAASSRTVTTFVTTQTFLLLLYLFMTCDSRYYTIIHVALVLSLFCGYCSSMFINFQEGSLAKIEFPFPLSEDGISFQLQMASYPPFYVNGRIVPDNLMPSQRQRFHVNKAQHVQDGMNVYTVVLKIDNITRHDAGTVSCYVYQGGSVLSELTIRTSVSVEFPPSKAECKPDNTNKPDHLEGWLLLNCTAGVGSSPGFFKCYQDGLIQPPRTDLKQNSTHITQVMWVHELHPAFCCSSSYTDMKERCQCSDFSWDPTIPEGVPSNAIPCPEADGTSSSEHISVKSTVETPRNHKNGEESAASAFMSSQQTILTAVIAIFLNWKRISAENQVLRELKKILCILGVMTENLSTKYQMFSSRKCISKDHQVLQELKQILWIPAVMKLNLPMKYQM